MRERDRGRRLVCLGLLLFFLGLLTGFVVPMFTNPRLGMSAHLEGVLNGMFLIVLGLIWKEVNLPRRAATAAYGLVLYGAFVNWAATLLGAGFGTHRLTPIAGAGYAGTAWQENLVATLVVSMVLSMAAGAALLLWGLVRRSA